MSEQFELPQNGWRPAGAARVKDGYRLACGYCQEELERYQVYLCHDAVANVVSVDRTCAERLTGDPGWVDRDLREAQYLWRIATTWSRRKWKRSSRGQVFINVSGYNVTIFEKGRGFGLIVRNVQTKRKQMGRIFYPTVDTTMRGALDAILWARRLL
jgi:hypothetical protein